MFHCRRFITTGSRLFKQSDKKIRDIAKKALGEPEKTDVECKEAENESPANIVVCQVPEEESPNPSKEKNAISKDFKKLICPDPCENEEEEEEEKEEECLENVCKPELWTSLYQDSDDLILKMSCLTQEDLCETEEEDCLSEEELCEKMKYEKYKATEVKIELPFIPDLFEDVCLTSATSDEIMALKKYYKSYYKNLNYFQYTKEAFYDAQIHMNDFRLPQPNGKRKSKFAKKTK